MTDIDLFAPSLPRQPILKAAPAVKVPPHSLTAEMGCLGCVLLEADGGLATCIAKLKAGPEVFHDLRCRTIYELMLAMSEKREPIDVVTVHQKLKDNQQLEAVGGTGWLAELPDKTPSAAMLVTYINIILGKFLLRQMLAHCGEFSQRVYEQEADTASLLEEFEKSAMAVRDAVAVAEMPTIKDLVKQRLGFYEECEQRGGGMVGLSTGYPDLDKLVDGLKGGEMVVIAARPACGKTTVSMNIAENVAIDQHLPVGIFSLEMNREALVGRMISSRSRVNERTITRAGSTEHDKRKLFTNAVKISSAPIFIDDTAGLTIMQLKARARRMKQQNDIRLLVIDYVQLIRPAKAKQNQQEEVSEISVGIKEIAKELRIPVIAICQLNREVDKDKERKPRISDLRSSGQLEQDADIIGLLYAADPVAAAANPDVLEVRLLIGKNRNGPCGVVNLVFHKNFTRFDSASRFDAVIQQPPKSWIPAEE